MPEAEQRQRGQRKVDHPNTRSMRTPALLSVSLPPAGRNLPDCGDTLGLWRSVMRAFFDRLFFHSGRFQQTFAGVALGFVDQRAVPSELVGTGPDHGHQQQVDQPIQATQQALELDEAVQGQQGDQCQGDREQACPPTPFFDRNPGQEHRGEHEQREDVVQPAAIIASVEDLQQEKQQAADQRHDQRRADGDHQVVDQGFVESASHGNSDINGDINGRLFLGVLFFGFFFLLFGRAEEFF